MMPQALTCGVDQGLAAALDAFTRAPQRAH
jgi:hypothetical protein